MKLLAPVLTCKHLEKILDSDIFRHFIAWRWFLVSLGVGTILNLINQYDAIWGSASLSKSKLGLTYLVPYLVSSISAWSEK